MLHLGAICRCPDLSGKSTQQPNTAFSPYIHVVPIHMDCRCPQREGGIEDQQEQWGSGVADLVYPTQGITALP